MKCVRFHEFGGSEVLRYEDAPRPVCSAGQVLVRVRAASVNHFDIWIRSGTRRRVPLPHVLGSDIAGELTEPARGVEIGTRVVLYPATSCGACQACLAGDESVCDDYRAIAGGYAEFVAASVENVYRIPSGLSFEEAAALPIAYLTAWRMVVTKARVESGMAVLVMGASGGVGTACVQIATALGARVIAGVRSLDKAAHVRGVGAEAVFDYTLEPAETALARFVGTPRVPVVLDHVGERVFDSCVAALARGGRLVSCGYTTGPDARLSLGDLTARELTLSGVVMGSRREFERLLDAVHTGRIKPRVSQVLPLERAREAHEILEQGRARGKIALVPPRE